MKYELILYIYTCIIISMADKRKGKTVLKNSESLVDSEKKASNSINSEKAINPINPEELSNVEKNTEELSNVEKNTEESIIPKKNSEEPKEVRLKSDDARKYFDVSINLAKKLKFSDVSLYSTTPTNQAKYTAELLLAYYTLNELKQKTLTDATACVGGNSWIFADYVKKVQANELSKLHVNILKNNMKVLGKENVSITQDNYLSNYLTLEQDIIFFDPPWGGVDYKQASEIEIALIDNNGLSVPIDKIINKRLSYQCETILLKLPVNYNIYKITSNCTFINIDDLLIRADPDNNPLYRLVLLSHLPKLSTPKMQSFPRLGYKSIIYSAVV